MEKRQYFDRNSHVLSACTVMQDGCIDGNKVSLWQCGGHGGRVVTLSPHIYEIRVWFLA